MTDWLPMAGGELGRAERWLNCCADRIIAADLAYRAAKTELEEASAAFDMAKREFDRMQFASERTTP